MYCMYLAVGNLQLLVICSLQGFADVLGRPAH